MFSSHGQSFGVLGGFFGGKKKSDISAVYLQDILIYLTPNCVCDSVP